jgi:N-acetylneuraminic acid mutarotase
MKLIPALCLFMLVFSVSCKKTSDQPNTPPPVTDTTKPLSPKPVITSFSPMTGAVDTTVTITGAHFSADISKDIVKFNGTTAVVKSGTDAQLVVTVPAGATTGKITVTIDTSTAISTQDFTVVAGGNWISIAGYPGSFMKLVTSFRVGNKLYMGLGQAYNGNLPEFWQYDVLSNVWTQKANFPTTPVPGHGVGFAIGGKGYVIMQDNNLVYPEVWEYDTASDKWADKGSAPHGIQTGVPAFTIDNYGYFGPSGDVSSGASRFWQYNPVANTWTRKADFPSANSTFPAFFVIGHYGYVGTGITWLNTATGTKEFYRYDPSNDTWTRKADFAGVGRSSAVGFSIGIYGYMGTGVNASGSNMQDFWQYNPATDTWIQVKDFSGGIRGSAIAFSGDKLGFVGYGQGPLHDAGPGGGYIDTYNDLWQYQP